MGTPRPGGSAARSSRRDRSNDGLDHDEARLDTEATGLPDRPYRGMNARMGVRKITVSLPPDLVLSMGLDAEEGGESVSSWVADAIARKLRRKMAREALSAFEAKHGALTTADHAAAKKLWPD